MTNTGGPAFPLHTPKWHELASQEGFVDEGNDFTMGMTLRDYFAAKALQGLITTGSQDDEWNEPVMAKWSYKMADAMLKARDQQ